MMNFDSSSQHDSIRHRDDISDEEDVFERENEHHLPETDEVDTHEHDSMPQWSDTIKYSWCHNKVKLTLGMWNTLSLGFAFFLLFLAVNTTQWFESSADIQWGRFVLVLFYVTASCSSLLFTAAIVQRVGIKVAFVSSFLIYELFVAGHIRLYPWLLLSLSVLSGAASSILWTAHGAYMVMISNPKTLGYLTGVFYSIYQLSSLFGNLLAAVLFTFDVNLTVFYLILSLIGLTSVAWVYWLIYYPSTQQPSDQLLQPVEPSTTPILTTLFLFKESRFLFVIPLFAGMGMHQGFCYAIWASSITPLSLLGWVMVTFSLANIFFSLFSGRLLHHLQTTRHKLILLILASLFFIIGLILFQFPPKSGVWSYFVTAVCLG